MIIKKLYHIRCQLLHYKNKAIIFKTNLLVAFVGFNFDIKFIHVNNNSRKLPQKGSFSFKIDTD